MHRILIVIALLISQAATGSDGAIEINQAKALAGGVTAGDTAGFPVTIDAQGSYVLTGNLTVLAHGVNAIHVTASEVSIDLSGFVITGPGDCAGSGASLSCLPVGLGSGIFTFLPGGGASPRVSVRRGAIRGFGAYGVFLGSDARVEDLVADVNGLNGIVVDAGSLVRDSIADRNGGDGIYAVGSIIRNCVAKGNRDDGISNTIGGLVIGSSVRDNGGFGLNLPGGPYLQNSIYLNDGGTVNGGINLGANSCNGTASCP